jgi:hypothetical protein
MLYALERESDHGSPFAILIETPIYRYALAVQAIDEGSQVLW